MPLKNSVSGETEAKIFYMAYTLDGVSNRVGTPADVLVQRRARLGVVFGCISERSARRRIKMTGRRDDAAAAIRNGGQPADVA